MPRSNSVAHLPTTPASDKGERQGCVERQSVSCPAAVGQEPQEDNPKENKASAELTPKSKTEYPQIMAKVAAICTKNEDESPVVLNAVSGMTLDELTEKHPSLRPNCSLSQEEYKSWAVKQLTEKEKGDTGLKPVEAVGLDNVQGEPQKTALEDSPERRPRSVDKEAESTLGPNPVIPRLFVKKSSQPSDYFKFLKESEVHSQGKNEALAPKTPKATSKKANSCDKKTLHLHRDEQGRFVSKPEPANDRLSATKKKQPLNIRSPPHSYKSPITPYNHATISNKKSYQRLAEELFSN
ncbi:uncharacterized protein AKAME5_000206700 [Lates japonicus]|uniref:Uncharacterized protein n=1 Tax=Lates japonicus TaxID=270547 RepID=A0AAD3QXI9_LATJO|nr:uncharacterized protein AKAME5_000206700 [Lates japonicus]